MIKGDNLTPGSRFVFDASNPFLISSRYKHPVEVKIIWNDGENIHYRVSGRSRIDQTPIERFKEVVEELRIT